MSRRRRLAAAILGVALTAGACSSSATAAQRVCQATADLADDEPGQMRGSDAAQRLSSAAADVDDPGLREVARQAADALAGDDQEATLDALAAVFDRCVQLDIIGSGDGRSES